MESGSTQAARPLGQTLKKKPALFWVVLSVLILAAAVVGAYTVARVSRHSQARHDVQVIALALDGFILENGSYPKGTRGEICRLLRGESINGQNPKKLDYVEALPSEMNSTGEFLDPWANRIGSQLIWKRTCTPAGRTALMSMGPAMTLSVGNRQ